MWMVALLVEWLACECPAHLGLEFTGRLQYGTVVNRGVFAPPLYALWHHMAGFLCSVRRLMLEPCISPGNKLRSCLTNYDEQAQRELEPAMLEA